jgi:hypothetical protein
LNSGRRNVTHGYRERRGVCWRFGRHINGAIDKNNTHLGGKLKLHHLPERKLAISAAYRYEPRTRSIMDSIKPISDLLLAGLRHVPPHGLAERLAHCSIAEWEELVVLATEQQVAPLLYHRLKGHGYETAIPTAIRDRLKKQYQNNVVRNMRLYHAIRQLVGTLQDQQIPVLILKGAYLAATVYESIALRAMVDLDILVPEAKLAAAVEQMNTLGYRPATPWLSLDAYLLPLSCIGGLRHRIAATPYRSMNCGYAANPQR